MAAAPVCMTAPGASNAVKRPLSSTNAGNGVRGRVSARGLILVGMAVVLGWAGLGAVACISGIAATAGVVSAARTTAPAMARRRRRRAWERAAESMLVSFLCASVVFLALARTRAAD